MPAAMSIRQRHTVSCKPHTPLHTLQQIPQQQCCLGKVCPPHATHRRVAYSQGITFVCTDTRFCSFSLSATLLITVRCLKINLSGQADQEFQKGSTCLRRILYRYTNRAQNLPEWDIREERTPS